MCVADDINTVRSTIEACIRTSWQRATEQVQNSLCIREHRHHPLQIVRRIGSVIPRTPVIVAQNPNAAQPAVPIQPGSFLRVGSWRRPGKRACVKISTMLERTRFHEATWAKAPILLSTGDASRAYSQLILSFRRKPA